MDTKTQNSLHQVLKSQTTELHKKGHTIPYIANLLNNDIQLISYIGHIRAFSIIYEALENQILYPDNETVNDILDGYSPRLPLLLNDLEYLNAKDFKDIEPAMSHAENVADKIVLYSKTNPYKLLGFVYTLEGSINGGSILKKHLTQTFNFENNHGTMYFSCLDDRFKKFWTDFVNHLNRITEKKHRGDVVSASREIFINIIKIYESLSPANEETVGK